MERRIEIHQPKTSQFLSWADSGGLEDFFFGLKAKAMSAGTCEQLHGCLRGAIANMGDVGT